jgi:hypothetical protein
METSLGLQRDYLNQQRGEAEKANEGGFGQFLRRMGIGILSSPDGRWQNALASGIRNVASAEEKQNQDYADRMAKINEAELQYGLQSAKLPYEIAKLTRESAPGPTAAELSKFYIDRLSDLEKQKLEIIKGGNAVNGANTAEIDAEINAMKDALAGLRYYIPQAAPTVIGSDSKAALGIK